jgi:aminoglycoside 3-N-acetyltransferase I
LEVARLSANDVGAAHALNALFAREFDDSGHYLSKPPPEEYLAVQLANPGIIALVARDGSDIIGGLVAYELPKLEQARSEIYI